MPATVELQKDLAHHLRQGHPWVFRKALARPPKLPPGEVVDVVSAGRFVARGLYDPISPIAVRIFARDAAEQIDAAFFARRVAQAAALRRPLFQDPGRTDSFRLVHGENDELPGVVVDRYADVAVLKLYSAALTPHRGAIVEAVRAAWPELRGIFGRDEVGREDDDESKGDNGRILFGAAPPERIAIREEGMQLWVDVRGARRPACSSTSARIGSPCAATCLRGARVPGVARSSIASPTPAASR